MTTTQTPRRSWSPARLALASALLAGLAVVLTLGDPGVTTDEPLDVVPGRKYVQTLWSRGLGFFERSTVTNVFADNAEHPPLGRWLLGIASTLGQPFEIVRLGPDPLGIYVLSGRMAPAGAFAVLVGLVVHTTSRRYGNPAALAAGFASVAMPRAFAHAHLGALDTFITLFWTSALFGADRALTARRPGLAMAGAGVIWGLALLTKIHAWFLIPVVIAWTVFRIGVRKPGRAFVAFSAWLASGLGLFFLGWPWLWYDTVARLLRFLGTGVVRTPIRVLYFGTVYADHDVPWHYPWFQFAVSVPVGLQLLGVVGLVRGWKGRKDDPFPLVLAGSIGMFLTIFSTKIPVYDGERLFLVVFPLWAVLIGKGFGEFWKLMTRPWRRSCLVAVLVCQSYGAIAMHPFGLSYYNALVGGLRGAERLGLELTYWGDAVDGELLDGLGRVLPEGEKVALVPTLYPGQGIASTTRTMARKGIVPGDEESARSGRWVVVSRRTAYWPSEFQERMRLGRRVVERKRMGVWLSAVVELPPPAVSTPNVQMPPGQSADNL